MAKFEKLADVSTRDSDARGAPEAEPPQEDGRLPIIHEESEADLEAHAMDGWCTELQEQKGAAGGNSNRTTSTLHPRR
eukprot:4903236-Pyramimonas_sp.AAC.1